MGRRLDKSLGRNKVAAKVEARATPPRTFVFALNHQRFDSWCHYHGEKPRSKHTYCIPTGSYTHQLRGFHIEPRDRIIVLENCAFGHHYRQAREDALIASGGWVDIDLREKVLT